MTLNLAGCDGRESPELHIRIIGGAEYPVRFRGLWTRPFILDVWGSTMWLPDRRLSGAPVATSTTAP
jgi:hypothetical protein